MNKIFSLLFSLFLLTSMVSASTVAGTLRDSSGTTVPNGKTVWTLAGCGARPLVAGAPLSTAPVTISANASAVLAGTVTQNSTIVCDSGSDSYYLVRAYTSANKLLWSRNYQVNATFTMGTDPIFTPGAPPAFLRSPMTAQGDAIVGGLGGAATRLPLGGTGTCQQSNGTTVIYGACVTSIALAAPVSDFTITGSPVTTNGTLTLAWTVAPTSAATINAIVKRDGSGNFSANVATLTGQTVNAAANGVTLVTLKRFTDTSPTGNFTSYINAAGAALWTVDITGSLSAGIIPSARLSGAIADSVLPTTVHTRFVVTFSATPALNATNGWIQNLTLTANVTSSTLTGGTDGQHLVLELCQDATGARTFVPPANVKGFTTIGATANTCTVQDFVFDSTKANWYATAAGVVNQ
jgi:hypothetical protein